MKAKKKVTSSQPASDKDYLEFLSGLKLIGLGLKSSEAALDRQKFWKLAQNAKRSSRRVSEAYQITEIGETYFEAEGRYGVVLGEGEGMPGVPLKVTTPV